MNKKIVIGIIFSLFLMLVILTGCNENNTGEETNSETKESEIINTSDLQIGDYINYDVAYTDINVGYDFSTNTPEKAWRILDVGTKNIDGTYSNVKIISTLVPAKLKTDNYEGTQQPKYNYEDLTENFEQMEFSNSGKYMNPDNDIAKIEYYEIIKEGQDVGDETTGAVFKIDGIADKVTSLSRVELNKALGRDVNSSEIIRDKDPYYLFDLKQTDEFYYNTLENNHKVSVTLEEKNCEMLLLDSGKLSDLSTGFNVILGVRPVVTLKSNIKIEKENDYLVIK